MKQEIKTTVDMLSGYPKDECCTLKVIDDGFAPGILPNDIVTIHKQSDIENGELAAVMVDGKLNAILRRVYFTESGITLTTDIVEGKQNRYELIVIPAAELYRVHICGKVISMQRDVLQAEANDWYGYGEREK